MNNRQLLILVCMISVSLVLSWLILFVDPPNDQTVGASIESFPSSDGGGSSRGPHGGFLLVKDNFALEITIYERGVPPIFRIYAFEDNRPLPPDTVQLKIRLTRLGGRADTINFQREADYLVGDKVVEEPHSFDIDANAIYQNKDYYFQYSTIEGRVTLNAQSLKNTGIEVKQAGPANIKTSLQLVGEIQFAKNRVAHVVPRIAGVAVNVQKELGDDVQRGEVIAILESRELANLKSVYATAIQHLDLSKALFEREDQLWREKISSTQDYLIARNKLAEAEIALASARQQLVALGISHEEINHIKATSNRSLSRYELRAPISGTIVEKHAVTGEAVQADSKVFVIADPRTVWVEFNIPANHLNHVRVGQKALVRAETIGFAAEGTVSYIGSFLDENTRTAPAHLQLANTEGRWRAGLFVSVQIIRERVLVPIAIRESAIQTWRDLDVVFVKYGDQFEVRPLLLGRRDEDWVEVIKGLSHGEHYVAGNSFVLKAELGKAGASHDH